MRTLSLVLVLGLVAGCLPPVPSSDDSEPPRKPSRTVSPPSRSPAVVDPPRPLGPAWATVRKDFLANPQAAKRKYKSVRFEVAEIRPVDFFFVDTLHARVLLPGYDVNVFVHFRPDEVEKLRVGEKATVNAIVDEWDEPAWSLRLLDAWVVSH